MILNKTELNQVLVNWNWTELGNVNLSRNSQKMYIPKIHHDTSILSAALHDILNNHLIILFQLKWNL